jgi:hypothetical protein
LPNASPSSGCCGTCAERDAAIVTHPDDLPFEQVLEIIRQSLRADHGRHMRVVDRGHGAVIGSGIFFFIPGPNVIAYSLRFRLVGHWLSMRAPPTAATRRPGGGRPSPQMTALRAAIARPAPERARAIEPIARDLGLAPIGPCSSIRSVWLREGRYVEADLQVRLDLCT